MKRLIGALVLLGACGDPPPFTLKFRITDGDSQACTTLGGTRAVTCSDIPMLCDSLVSVRIFAPSDPTAPFISACEPLNGGTGKTDTLCQIASVNLTPPMTPTRLQDLEIDMVVYPKDDRFKNPDGTYTCPHDASFGADGFLVPPEPCMDTDQNPCVPPAVGGRAFYHPGDEETVVTLGCADLAPLQNMSCVGPTTHEFTASVTDFDTAVSVSSATADGLLVSVGEPVFDSGGYVLRSADTFTLLRDQQALVPVWTGDVNFSPTASACTEVFEDGAQTTAAVSCTNAIGADPLDLPGIRLAKGTLDKILSTPPLTGQFPLQGLVIGKALDYFGAPAAGVQITPSDPSVEILYLSEDGTTFTASGITSSQGIWISRNAAYGTVFHAQGPTPAPDAFGGLIAGKADIVITQLKPPGNG